MIEWSARQAVIIVIRDTSTTDMRCKISVLHFKHTWPKRNTTPNQPGGHYSAPSYLTTYQTLYRMDPDAPLPQPAPSIWRWVVGFLMVGACWGLTTPFMRRAAVQRDLKPQQPRPYLTDPNVSWLQKKIWGVIYAVLDLLRNPNYAIPLLLNVTGSVWFFLLIGQAGMYTRSLNSMAAYL